jgi:uncharacterized protein YuzE
MKIKYYKQDDILVIKLSNKPYDHAEMEGNFVIHLTEDERPVRIEVLDASKFLKVQSKALPKDVKEKFFTKFV